MHHYNKSCIQIIQLGQLVMCYDRNQVRLAAQLDNSVEYVRAKNSEGWRHKRVLSLTIIPVRKTTRFLKLSWDFENMWWRLYRFTGHFLLANGILTGHFLYGDRGIKDLCGRFPPTDSEKYLTIFNRSNFWIEAR